MKEKQKHPVPVASVEQVRGNFVKVEKLLDTDVMPEPRILARIFIDMAREFNRFSVMTELEAGFEFGKWSMELVCLHGGRGSGWMGRFYECGDPHYRFCYRLSTGRDIE